MKYERISNDRLVMIQNHLAESNAILEKYHSKIASDCGRLGFRVVGTKDKFNKIDFVNFISKIKEINEDVVVHDVIVKKDDAIKIAKSKEYESEILLNFMYMFSKIAHKWSSYNSDVCLSKQDLESHAFEAAMNAIYSYTSEKNTGLSTYLYHCVTNKVRNVCNKTNSFSDYGSNAIKLRRRFEEARTLSPNLTYDEIIESLDLSKKEMRTLESILVGVSASDNFGEDSKSNDYTCFGKRFSGLDGEIKFSCSSNGRSFTIREEGESQNAINVDFSEFSELEKVVFEGFMNSKNNLGISHFAKNCINPKTGKKYSRMAITYAWRRVLEKIKKHTQAA